MYPTCSPLSARRLASRLLATTLLVVGAGPTLATDRDDLLAAGREMARPCTTCHGLEGQRQAAEMPVIGGRPQDDLLYELGRFQRADRFQPAMTLLLQTFDEKDLVAVAAYFANQDPDRPALMP
jgi:cytochrome c553